MSTTEITYPVWASELVVGDRRLCTSESELAEFITEHERHDGFTWEAPFWGRVWPLRTVIHTMPEFLALCEEIDVAPALTADQVVAEMRASGAEYVMYGLDCEPVPIEDACADIESMSPEQIYSRPLSEGVRIWWPCDADGNAL